MVRISRDVPSPAQQLLFCPEEILARALGQAERQVVDYVLDELAAGLGAQLVLLVPEGGLEGRESRLLPAAGPGCTENLLAPALTVPVFSRAEACFAAGERAGAGTAASRPPETPAAGWRLGVPVLRDGRVVAGFFAAGATPGPRELETALEAVSRSIASTLALALLAGEVEGAPKEASSEAPRPPEPSRMEESLARQTIACPAAAGPRRLPRKLGELFPEIIGRSAAIRGVLSAVADLAPSEIPILIEGESGTGKELIAAAIHRLSKRRGRPFVSENCGAIPEQLVEAELFGYERGSFTGATESKPGLVELAAGGTLFLDEVGEMDLKVQRRFLRVLQEKEVRRIGGHSPRPVDFRLISATNRVLEELVAEGKFREDLFYRLHVASISLPALRERREDIPLLVEYFNRRFAAELGKPPLKLAPETLAILEGHSWPGNVRELRNEVWRLVTAASGTGEVAPSCLSQRLLKQATPRPPPVEERKSFDEIEREVLGGVIAEALSKAGGNRAQAARILGIARATLYRRMERYGLPIEPERGETRSRRERSGEAP
jgi:DNA-binding NtrC family response regulator